VIHGLIAPHDVLFVFFLEIGYGTKYFVRLHGCLDSLVAVDLRHFISFYRKLKYGHYQGEDLPPLILSVKLVI